MRHGPALVRASRMAVNHRDVSALQAQLEAASEDRATSTSQQNTQKCVRPVPVPGESALYQVPEGLALEYRNLPSLVQASLWLVAGWVSALSTLQRLRLAWIRPLLSLSSSTGHVQWTKVFSFVLKTMVLALSFTVVLQDLFFAPSRLTTQQLLEKFFLPSQYSRYQAIARNDEGNATQGVHYLLCEQQGNSTGLIYLNHGFGASSLSWLPAMKPLLDRLGYRKVVAHDAPGFGFTDRPNDWLEPYTSRGSARIGYNLLKTQQEGLDQDEPILLMGHSMGSVTALRMALLLPSHVPKRIVLVDPALGIRPNSQRTTNVMNKVPVSNFFYNRIVDPLGSYILKRAVGRPGFWRAGLQLAWGDASRLKDSDVLRFQWPALGKGWEKGMIKFTRAQLIPMEVSDRDLVKQVLALPNTTVDVIYGGSDPIVKPSLIEKFFMSFLSQGVNLVALEGLGHDPFEEDAEAFINALEELLQ
uniref:AB hydrolase-1 domain-containing protein n=1 Tax=Entomoneis paludosa TaxID=265537 RepID=A0A7S2YTM6_9STRA|mmetsp:Transcript_9699/g.20094  ORF Transcript_9699/g.20094 Transcript_9699/m.20094 type:complete len:473 (+) Transcript_9699:89-1507(+)